MIAQRIGLRFAFVCVAAVLQVVVINQLGLPYGTPDLLVLVVVAFGLASGPARGALLGFWAGLLADVIPPAGHIAGRWAFAYTIVGYLAGLLEDPEESSVFTTILVVAGGSAAAIVMYAAVGGLLGDARVHSHIVVQSLIATVVYDVILAPFIVPIVANLARRYEPVGPR